MSKIFENEYLVKAWEGDPASKAIVRKHYDLSLSGKFFIATKTGLLVDNSGNIQQRQDVDIARTVDDFILRKGWQKYSVEDIAHRVSETLKRIDAVGVFDFAELEIKLIEKLIGAEDGIEACEVLERPVIRKMPSLTHYD